MQIESIPMKIFFDGECPLCSREIAFLKKRDKDKNIQFVDISDDDFDPVPIGKTKTELMARIHGQVGETLIEGVDVFREAYSRVGLGWILWLTKIPVFKQLADVLYLIFAKYRLRIGNLFSRCGSGTCNLK